MKPDHPPAIDRYIDFFGDGTRTGLAALDTLRPAIADSGTVDRRDPAAGDDPPRR
jgi:hypothetical protein